MNIALEKQAGPLGDLDVVVRDRGALDAAVVDPTQQPQWISRLLRLGVVGLALHGVVVGLIVQALPSSTSTAAWFGPLPVLTLPLALVAALYVGLAVCLPSFYFYTRLSGLDVSFRFITAQALRVQAHTAVLLLGALPAYAAIALAARLGVGDAETVGVLGVVMPFILGLAGIRALYQSFVALLPDLPITHERRGRFLLRLVLAWGLVYSAVTPVALWRIGGGLAGVL